MNIFKKTAVLLTVASMLTVNIFGYMPINSFEFPTFTASATEMVESGECGAQGDNLTWILDNEGTLTISGKGDMMNWKIGSSPWNEDDIIKNIIIENGVTSIGDSAFYNCVSLTSITIPDSVTSIGNYVFIDCKVLTSITIPDSVTSIGDSAFEDCIALTSIIIPDSVISIGDSAFYNCKALNSITIPNNITNIGYSTFTKTPWLEEQRILNPLVIFNGILIDGYACKGDIVIPDGVTNILGDAFENCSAITSITIPDSVTSIGDNAFYSCNALTSISIPDSVTSIGDNAFYRCTALTSISIPDSVTEIGGNAFGFTPWIDIQREKNPLVIVNRILIDGKTCKGDVIIPNGVIRIADYAFSFTSSLFHVDYTPTTPLDPTSITSITIPDTVTTINYSAFSHCYALASIKLPDNLTTIKSNTFSDCKSLTSIIIPDSVTCIEDNAFDSCKSLTSIIIPENVTSIESYAFYGCYDLTSITIKNPECKIYQIQETIPDKAIIYGYEGSTAQDYAEYYKREFMVLGEAPGTTNVSTATDILPGDANCDKKVDIADVIIIKCYLINNKQYSISQQGLINADVNERGNGINIQDSLATLKYILKLIDSL